MERDIQFETFGPLLRQMAMELAASYPAKFAAFTRQQCEQSALAGIAFLALSLLDQEPDGAKVGLAAVQQLAQQIADGALFNDGSLFAEMEWVH